MSRVAVVLRRWAPKNPFARGVTVLASGTAFGQAVSFVSAPIITRLYTPEDFGVLAVYASVLGMIGSVSALKYELATPIARRDAVAANVLALTVLIPCAVAVAAAALIGAFGGDVARMLGAPKLEPLLPLLPIGIAAVGVYRGLSYWAIRKRAYAWIARTKVSQSVGSVATQVGFGVFSGGPLGLLLGNLVGQAGGSLRLAGYALRHSGGWYRAISLRRIRFAALRYRRFPQLASGSALLNSTGAHLAPLLLSTLYGSPVAGWFAFAERVIGAPLTLIGTSVAQVYYGEAAKLVDQPADLRRLLLRTAGKLALIVAVPSVILVACGAWLFEHVFGAEWRVAGQFAQIVAPLFFLKFVTGPVAQNLNLLERQDLSVAWNVTRLALAWAGIGIPSWLGWGHSGAVVSYALGMCAAYVGLIALNVYAIDRRAMKAAAAAAGETGGIECRGPRTRV